MTRTIIGRNTSAVESILDRNQIEKRHRSPHLGLVFDRFPRLLDEQTLRIAEDARSAWLKEFKDLAAGTSFRERRLAAVHARLDVVVKERGGEHRTFRTVERFATGLGNPNAADIGFSFDAACGVPCLAGSAVKGLVREGARIVDADKERIAALLGEGPVGTADATRGKLVFLDALPAKWPEFDLDIITRHHNAEALAQQKTPLDADEPNPVPFLTVQPQTALVFRVLPEGPSGNVSADAMSNVWDWLTVALDLGAGARSAVGYGRMFPDVSVD